MNTTAKFVASLFISVILAANAFSDSVKIPRGCEQILPGLCDIDVFKGEIYNIAQVRSHRFVETWSSKRMGALYIRAHVANQKSLLSRGPFAPIVTLAFLNENGKKNGEVKLRFNVPAIRQNEWHETYISGGSDLWDQSSSIDASAAESNTARPPEGSWTVTIGVRKNVP